MKPADIGTCSTCDAFEPAGILSGAPAGAGVCHLSPPVMLAIATPNGAQIMPVWSAVPGEQWCMAWEGEQAETPPRGVKKPPEASSGKGVQ